MGDRKCDEPQAHAEKQFPARTAQRGGAKRQASQGIQRNKISDSQLEPSPITGPARGCGPLRYAGSEITLIDVDHGHQHR